MKIRFITGGAGTGKSFTLRKMLQKEKRKFIVCAPTGIAAQNVNGVTIHSAFNINPDSLFVPSSIARGPLNGLGVIYIDEVSMVGAQLFKAVWFASQHLGVEEIICFGDLAQLPPVKDKPFHHFKLPTEITELTTVHRQADDLNFAEVLNDIRNNDHTYEQIQFLNKLANYEPDEDTGITLAYSNAVVDSINTKSLNAMSGDLHLFKAKIGGGMSGRDVLAPEELYVKEGSSVIMLNNDLEGRWKNGTPAVVTKCYEDEDAVQVRIGDEKHEVYPHVWTKKAPKELRGEALEQMQQLATGKDPDTAEYATHCLNNGYALVNIGTFEQLPLKLAYAMTVHKSQGLTLEKAKIIPDGFGKMHGIGYVALSRLTALSGLSLYRPLKVNDFRSDSKILL
jgi:ATP-dependent DNA helicase PIF1